MPVLQLKRQEQITARILQRLVARTELSDVTDSSVMHHIAAAVAREIDDVYYQLTRMSDLFSLSRAAGDDLDERAKDVLPSVLTRIQASYAIGSVVFSRSVVVGTVTVPAGTSIKTADGLSFRTTAQAIITPTSTPQISGHLTGQDSNAVSAIADAPGANGNVATNSVVKFASIPSGIDSVTNTTSFTQGRDKESDDEFRSRLLAFVASLSRCTVDAIQFAVLGVTDQSSGKQVVFSNVFEDPINLGKVTVYVDDGNGTAESTVDVSNENVTFGLAGPPINSAIGGEEFLQLDYAPVRIESPFTLSRSTIGGSLTQGVDYFANPANGRIFMTTALEPGETVTCSYTYYTGLISAVQKVIDGDPNDRVNYPGYRAAGVEIRAMGPSIREISVAGTLILANGYDRSSVIAEAENAVIQYVNTLGISGDVIRNELIQRIMEVPGVVDLVLTYPSANIAILDNELPRISSSNIEIL